MVGLTPYLVGASGWFGPPDRPLSRGLNQPSCFWREGARRRVWRAMALVRAIQGETKPSISAGGRHEIPRACPKAGEHWRSFTPNAVEPWSNRTGADRGNPIKPGCFTDSCSEPLFQSRKQLGLDHVSELRDLLAKSKLHMGLRVGCLVDSNSLTPWGPLSKQNQTVLFNFSNFT